MLTDTRTETHVRTQNTYTYQCAGIHREARTCAHTHRSTHSHKSMRARTHWHAWYIAFPLNTAEEVWCSGYQWQRSLRTEADLDERKHWALTVVQARALPSSAGCCLPLMAACAGTRSDWCISCPASIAADLVIPHLDQTPVQNNPQAQMLQVWCEDCHGQQLIALYIIIINIHYMYDIYYYKH